MQPSVDYRRTSIIKPDKVSTGLDAVLDYLVGTYQRSSRFGTDLLETAQRIDASADEIRHLNDRLLKTRLQEMKAAFRRQGPIEDSLAVAAMPLLVEAAHRSLGMRPYPVQVMAALALHHGYLAEMATGEGKSLTAALAGVLAGWTERPCHILTTNDYLAGRDGFEFRKFYHYCGVSVGSVVADMEPDDRREAYRLHVVYTTSKELLADFLRDRIYLGNLHHPQRRLLRELLEPRRRIGDGIVLRGIDTAIIDEADSVMVDEAVTPLIISTQQENKWLVEATQAASQLAEKFEASDYSIDRKYREIEFEPEGLTRLESLANELPLIWRGSSRREEIVKQAIVAREFYKIDQHYVIQDEKIVIVDEFTGRLMHARSWGNGLHQAVEAKEELELTSPTETLARLSFQRFFRLFRKMSGMTGTAREAASEFWHIYRMPVMSIPTNRPLIRDNWKPLFFEHAEDKWQSILAEVKAVHASGRPVLVGTRSVKSSQIIADLLAGEGLHYRLLNATRHEDEAHIIRDAGREKMITIATNMAGRGTDIKLEPVVAKAGGLHVIVSERNDSGRIDRQLVGRCARQGDPGSGRIFASLEDDLVTRFAPKWCVSGAHLALEKRPEQAEMVLEKVFDFAQNTAQRIAYRQRKTVLRTDTWLDDALIFAGSDGVH